MRSFLARSLSLTLVATFGLARADQVDTFLEKWIAENKVPGLQIGIFKNGSAVKAKGYGQTALENGRAVDEKTRFNIGSITKQFTSAALMVLAEEGKLSLDDPIRKHLPELPADFGGVLLRQVMGHVGGFGDYGSVPGFRFADPMSESDFLAAVAKTKPLSAPGEKYTYSNIGYSLLGVIVHRASGKPYEAFVRERILEKLGMMDTAFIQPGLWPADAAVGYVLAEGKLSPGPTARSNVAAPSGALLTHALDMSKWDAALRGDAFLKKESKEALFTAGKLLDGSSTNYGLGWNVLATPRGRFVSHTGATVAGFRAAIIRQLDGPYSAVVFANVGADLRLTKLLDDVVTIWRAEFDRDKSSSESGLERLSQSDERHLDASRTHLFSIATKAMLLYAR